MTIFLIKCFSSIVAVDIIIIIIIIIFNNLYKFIAQNWKIRITIIFWFLLISTHLICICNINIAFNRTTTNNNYIIILSITYNL